MEVTSSSIADSRLERSALLLSVATRLMSARRLLVIRWIGVCVLAVTIVWLLTFGSVSGFLIQRNGSPLPGAFSAIVFLLMAAGVIMISVVFNFRFCRLIPAAVKLKGGRWTKDQCGGVQGWRAGLSGPVWADRRRSGWFRPPPHWFRRL